nr:PAS domain S-box protein [Marinobacterium ramblicola]
MFKVMFEQSPIGQILFHEDGRIRRCNAALADLLGKSVDTLLDSRGSGLIYPEDRQLFRDTCNRLNNGGELVRRQLRFLHHLGLVLPLDGIFSLLSDDQCRPLGIFCQIQIKANPVYMPNVQWGEQGPSLTDIVLDHIREAIYLCDDQGRIRDVNDAACRMLGYSRDKLLTMTIPDIDPGVSLQWILQRWEGLQRLGHSVDALETRHRTREGQLVPVEISSVLLEYGGEYFGLSLVRDISERKQAEQLAHKREQEFRALVEHSPDYVTRYDREGRKLYVNPALLRRLDMSEADFLAWYMHRDARIPGHLDDTYVRHVWQTIDTGIETRTVFGKETTDGKVQYFDTRFVPEFDREGNFVSVLTIAREITRLKEVEQELLESRTLLRELGVHRETELERERKRIAREVHDELGQLLTTLRLRLNLIRRRYGEVDPRIQEDTGELVQLVDRTIAAVRDIATALRPAVLEMGIVSALEWMAEEFSQHSGIRCELDIPEPFDLDEARAIGVFRIVQESLTNVARHAGAQRVEIGLYADGGGCRLVVRDDGEGFDPGSVTGNSIGLVGMQERALSLGGRLSIAGQSGNGTELELMLPLMLE